MKLLIKWLYLLSYSRFFSYNINISQKKFYIYNIKLINNKVILCSRSKEELDKIDFEKELSPLNINESYLLDNLKYFMNFEGFAMIFTFKAETNKNEIKDIYGIAFFKISHLNIYDVRFFRLYYESDINIMLLILTKYLQAGEFEVTVNWVNMFLNKVENLNEEKKFKTFKMFIDLKSKFRFLPLTDYDSLVKFVKNSILLSQKNISQKKFYCDNKEQIFIKSKEKKELSKVSIPKEMEKLDKEMNIGLMADCIDDLKKFKGFIVLFECNMSIRRFKEKEDILGMVFFNYFKIDKVNTKIIKLYYDHEINTISLLLKLFVEENIEDKNKWLEWEEHFNKIFYLDKKNHFSELIVDKNTAIKFHKFRNLNELINYLDNIKLNR